MSSSTTGTPQTGSQAGRRSTPSVPKRCRECKGADFRRVNRGHVLERTLLTWLGFYPWECVICRTRRYFRDNGHRRRGVRSQGAAAASSNV